MGSFANSVFRTLLGWVKTVTQRIWISVNGEEQSGFAAWFGRNWLKLFLILCFIGVILDFVIYIIRWQPYKVWKTFLQRRRQGAGEDAEDVYDGISDGEITQKPAFSEQEEPEYPVLQHQEIPEEQSFSGNTEKFSKAIQPGRRRRRAVSDLFSDGTAEVSTLPPDSLIDSDEAYYRPVYPKNWKGSGEQPEE